MKNKDLVSCSHCGVVRRGHTCPYRKTRKKTSDKKSDRFRHSNVWTTKSLEIRTRDKFLCQLCIRNLYNTLDFLNYKNVDVHHITPIEEDYNRRLDNDNLVSLCRYHHKMADDGIIPKDELYKIAEEQNNVNE